MKRLERQKMSLTWLVVGVLSLCGTATAAPPSVQPPAISDIVLSDGGAFNGRIVDAKGTPVSGVPVSFRSGAQVLAKVTTGASGNFSVSGLRTGSYQVATPSGVTTYQAWDAGSAPPSAQAVARVTHRATVRPFRPGSAALVVDLVGTAIAVPIAISNSHRTPASGQ